MNIIYLGQQTAQSDSPANKRWLFAAATDPICDDGDVDCQRRHCSTIKTSPHPLLQLKTAPEIKNNDGDSEGPNRQ